MILTIETRLAVATLPHTRTLGMTDQGFQLELKKTSCEMGSNPSLFLYLFDYVPASSPGSKPALIAIQSFCKATFQIWRITVVPIPRRMVTSL